MEGLTAQAIIDANDRAVADINAHWRVIRKAVASGYWSAAPLDSPAYRELCSASRWLYSLESSGRIAEGRAVKLVEAVQRECESVDEWTEAMKGRACRALANADMVRLQVSGECPDWMAVDGDKR